MSKKRILSLWFPRLAAERFLRLGHGLADAPFAVVGEISNAQVLVSLSEAAENSGLTVGQPLRDAAAMCPGLQTKLENKHLDRNFLTIVRRWAGKFSPWVAEVPPDGLVIDLTGCAHLFGGEAALLDVVETDCSDLGLTVQAGIADTVGAAWALARFSGSGGGALRSGDDIVQEARATRSRAAKRRHWERGGAAPSTKVKLLSTNRIAATGQTRTALAPLPVAALRIDPDTVATLMRLGLRKIEDLIGQPRAALSRRFGIELVQRLDQALGMASEPVSPAKPPVVFTVRLTFPDPIGLTEDVAAGIDRLLPAFCAKLRAAGRGVRSIRLECHRTDQTMQLIEVGLARPASDPERIRPLLLMKISDLDAGFGIDTLRLIALGTEPVTAIQHNGPTSTATAPLPDLMGKIGARFGLSTITRVHPAGSHLPEKSSHLVAAIWADPAEAWPQPGTHRPLELWRPEIVTAPEEPLTLPARFRWRGRDFETKSAIGPERISPEWWLDDPDWRSGVRDYWRLTTQCGERLWLYFAHGAALSPGWFCQGRFP